MQITLYRTTDVWAAKYDDPAIVDALGTDTLPTAYTAQANPDMVRREIARLNPDYAVTIEE